MSRHGLLDGEQTGREGPDADGLQVLAREDRLGRGWDLDAHA